MAGIRRSLLLASAQSYASLLINFATVVITARLLTPADIGVAVLGLSVVGLAELLREFGTSTFLIQQPEITREKVRTAFTIMLLLSCVLSGTLFLLSSSIAAYYGNEALDPYLRLTALGLMMGPFVSPILALLRREMAFGTLAVLSVVGASVNMVAVVTLALMGYRYMSFAWANLFSGMLGVLLALWVRPGLSIFRPSLSELRGAIAFAGYDSATVILNSVWNAFPYFVYGRVLGIEAVGLYNRAVTVCLLPERALLASLTAVLLPVFSAQAREGHSLKSAYLRAIEYITALHWPALILLAIFAHPVVHILLGHQWTAIAPLVQIISVALLAWFPAYLTYPTLVATGGIRDTLTASLISLPIAALILTVASRHGLHAVALSMLITIPLQVAVAVTFVRRRVGFAWSEMLAAIRKSIVVAALSAAGPGLFVAMLGQRNENSIAFLIIGLVIAAIGWLAGLRMTCHPLMDEIFSLWHKLCEAPKYREISIACGRFMHRFALMAARNPK